MKHKCSYCGKVKTVEYRGPYSDEFFCSKECASGMSGIVNIADGKCAICGKPLSESHGIFTTMMKILISFRNHFVSSPEMYCSEECLMKANGCLTTDEWDKFYQSINRKQDKEVEDET